MYIVGPTVFKDNIYIPVVYFLLKTKQCRTYTTNYVQTGKKQCPSLAITVAYFDFEIVAHTAFWKVFPGVAVRGCRFHPAQASKAGKFSWKPVLACYAFQPTKSQSSLQQCLQCRRKITKQCKTLLSTWKQSTLSQTRHFHRKCGPNASMASHRTIRTVVKIFINILEVPRRLPNPPPQYLLLVDPFVYERQKTNDPR